VAKARENPQVPIFLCDELSTATQKGSRRRLGGRAL